MVAYTTNETAALDDDVHRLRHNEFYATTKGMNLYFFILCNRSLSHVHTNTTTESVETGTMKYFATIDVLVTTIVNATADALAVFTDRQRALQPLVWVATIAIHNH